jgi:hypothetical protein
MELLDLPDEMIYYIVNFLDYSSYYNFSVTNSRIYQNIWKPIDLGILNNYLIYMYNINLYSCYWSYNQTGYIKLPYNFEKQSMMYRIGMKFENNYLYVKVASIRSSKLEMITSDLIDNGYHLVEVTQSEVELRKLSIGVDKLDFFHKETYNIICQYNGENQNYYLVDQYLLLLENIMNDPNFYEVELLNTFWLKTWEPSAYHYIDTQNITAMNIGKQKELSRKIYTIIKDLDNSTIKKIINYITNQ